MKLVHALRFLPLLAAVLALALFAGCGDDDDEGDGGGGDSAAPQKVAITVQDKGGNRPHSAPRSGVEAGVNELTLQNTRRSLRTCS